MAQEENEEIKKTVRNSVVTALTIATALIWKDFIERIINLFVPENQKLFFHFLSVVISTAIVVVIIYIYLVMNKKAEKVINDVSNLKSINQEGEKWQLKH